MGNPARHEKHVIIYLPSLGLHGSVQDANPS